MAMPFFCWSRRDMQSRGVLTGSTIVATTMSNMGLEIALRKSGIRMLRANVGDKYVLEEMLKTGAILGGEQSGHIIFRDGEATTGDGLLTALRVMEIMARSWQVAGGVDRRSQSLSADHSECSGARKDSVRPGAGNPAYDRSGRTRTRWQWTRGRPLLGHGSAGPSDGGSGVGRKDEGAGGKYCRRDQERAGSLIVWDGLSPVRPSEARHCSVYENAVVQRRCDMESAPASGGDWNAWPASSTGSACEGSSEPEESRARAIEECCGKPRNGK